ncbi:MAG: helix-turn-helix domain-containing protein [Alphaproteobacteria bacterium]
MITEFGDYLRLLRHKRRINTETMARHIGIPRPNLSLIENGRRPMAEKHLSKIVSALNLTTDESLKLFKLAHKCFGKCVMPVEGKSDTILDAMAAFSAAVATSKLSSQDAKKVVEMLSN